MGIDGGGGFLTWTAFSCFLEKSVGCDCGKHFWLARLLGVDFVLCAIVADCKDGGCVQMIAFKAGHEQGDR